MTGINSYSTTASENVSANTGINWDEGMPPATVNNSARQNMADMRALANDGPWFEYGVGSKTVAHVYSSSTATTLSSSTDATAYWHTGRRVRAVGASTGTIYGKVASSSFSSNTTTVNYTWDSGSLSNETLTIHAGTPVTGKPVPFLGIGDTAIGSWTPADASGGGVSFSATAANYVKIGRLVYVDGILTYGSTVNGNQAAIGGLPFDCANQTGIGGAFAVDDTVAADFGRLNANTTNFSIYTSAGTSRLNSDLSGKTVRFQFLYMID